MTPEQLDKIENRQAAAMWIGGPTAAFAQDTLLLIKALREAWEKRDEAIEARAQAGYSAAQFMRKFNEAEKERDEARAEVERLRSAISRFVTQYPWQDGPEIQELKALKERE